MLPGSNLERACRYILAVLEHAEPIQVPLVPTRKPPVLIYTDASLEQGIARIGAWVWVAGSKPLVLVYDPSPRLLALCGPSEHFVNQAELMAAPILAYSVPKVLQGQDIFWWIDNTSAETALVKAGSPTEDMCHLALLASAAFTGLRARVWFDRIDSDSNVYADALSRGGLEDPLIAAKIAAGEWATAVPVEPPVLELDYDLLMDAIKRCV